MDAQALAILNEALACENPAEREAVLQARCGDRPELLARVRDLLDQVTETEIGSVPARADPAQARIGQRIGAFRLVKVIGHGGMGVVYLAERVDGGFEQRVALKLIRADTAVLAERFLRERRILARLNHPGIAHLVDGGLTDHGQAWFAMEYVDGERITDWCDRQRLGLRGRVELLCRVGEAVQFAHAALIVHRDLKPANILVDAGGGPKLLDFGIARLLDETDSTAAPTLSLTPAYAAPEQVRGEPVTTTSDVYQLGLVLFEVLTGVAAHSVRPPAHADGGLATLPRPDQVLRTLASQDPARSQNLADLRRSSFDRLQRRLRGDLGRITAKALATDPRQRYESVAALVQDLRRWLADRPVRAHRGHVGYRLRKFLRRNWAASAAVALLVVSIGYHLIQLDASNARIRAERDQAQAIAGFMQELFSAADPRMQPRAETTARELLDLGAERITATPGLSAIHRANLLATVARSYQSIGEYPEARALYREAMALLEGDSKEHLALRAHVLALATQADTEGNFQEQAEQHHALALTLLQRLDTRAGLAHAYALGAAAGSLQNQRRFEEAIGYYEQLLALRGQLFDQDARYFCGALLTSGGLLEILHLPEAAARRSQEAVDAYYQTFGERHPDYGKALAQLADQQTDLHRYADAERNYREGIAILRTTLGDEHRDVGIKLNNLALMQSRLGRFDEALAALDEALPILRQVFGDDNAYVAAGLYNRGTALIGAGRYREATEVLDEAWRIIDAAPASAYWPRIVHARARLSCHRDEVDLALQGFEHAAERYGNDRVRRPTLDWHRADCLIRHGRDDEARGQLPAIVEALRTGLGDEAWETQQAAQALAEGSE